MTGDAVAAGVTDRLAADTADLDAEALWAASGGMVLTGDAGGPALGTLAPVAAVFAAAGRQLADAAGHPLLADPAALLGERAAVYAFTRQGRTSCGGGARLLRAADAWVAVALPRPVDIDAVPAWLGAAPSGSDPWPLVAEAAAATAAAELAARARLLEIPCSVVGEHPPTTVPWVVTNGEGAAPVRTPLVADLSALWAGPLCAQLLGLAGARVVKVEDPARPDGTRLGPRALLDLLNGGKRSVALDLTAPDGRRALDRLLAAADVVISSSRPRAFEALGIDVAAVLARRPTVWVAITAHGWAGAGRDRVGFGDDTGVAGGLVTPGPGDGEPRFVADAVADPLTGVLAAVIARAVLARGGSWFVDAPLARASAFATGLGVGGRPSGGPPQAAAAAPRARHAPVAAAALGADSAAVLAEIREA